MKGEVVGFRRRGSLMLCFGLLAGLILGAGVMAWGGKRIVEGSSAPASPVYHVASGPPVDMRAFANGFASVVKPALPAVVNISTSKIIKQPRGGAPFFFNDPFFQQFFGNQFGQQFRPRPEREKSLGSGVIVSSDGFILTNNHVVDGASDIKVETPDKRDYTAKLVGTDPRTDIAVLKIDAKDLPSLALGDSSKMQVGDVVLAIGDPFGVGETVTMGIVSATGRGGLGIEGYEDFIQTDAAINPGNSGGALIDMQGNCIGINTAILSGGSGGNQGIGFAIPINMARHVMDEIMKNGKVVRGYLGVYIQPLTPDLAKQFGLGQGGGALVNEVTPDAPASKAGIVRGDVILELDGKPVRTTNDLQVRISQEAPGTVVHLKVLHDGKTRDVAVKLGELPEKETAENGGATASSALDGVRVQALTADIAQQLNLPPGTRGVVVVSVDPSSNAADAGLTRGDVIQEVNHKQINNEQDYSDALSSAGKNPVLLLINRGGNTLYLVVQP